MDDSLSTMLEKEHHEIDSGIETFLAGLARGETRAPALARAVEALRRHIYLEEEFLFPPLRAAGMLAPVLVMLREHGAIWRTLDAIEALEPDQVGDLVREHCDELLHLLGAHNAKEEPIIYPQGDLVLSEEARHELGELIENASMPQGWVCAQA